MPAALLPLSAATRCSSFSTCKYPSCAELPPAAAAAAFGAAAVGMLSVALQTMAVLLLLLLVVVVVLQVGVRNSQRWKVAEGSMR
jgi:hypothetical protein